MAVPADCIRQAADALKRELTQDETKFLQREIDRERTVLAQTQPGLPPETAMKLAADRLEKRLKKATLIEKRNAYLNRRILLSQVGYVANVWKGREAEGLLAIITGSIEGRKGARSSAAAMQEGLRGKYHGGILYDLEKAGVLPAFKSGSIDREVSRALWQLNSPSPDMRGLPREAVQIAEIVHKYQEAARLDANRAGANIGKLAGYITRQSHDLYRIQAAGLEAWKADIAPRLDWARIDAEHGPVADKGKFLDSVYQGLASGVHLKAAGAQNTTGLKGPRNLARSMSEERTLHFKSADDWFDYNAQFGTGNLREAVMGGLTRAAQNTGLMQALGTNPEVMVEQVVDHVARIVRGRGDPKSLGDFSKAAGPGGAIRRHLSFVNGEANIPVSHTLATYASNARALTSMAKLGGALISSVTDLATYASEMRFQGRSFMGGFVEAIGNIGRGRPTGERRRMAASLGVFFDSMAGALVRNGSLDETFTGSVGRGMHRFFTWNGLTWWTETLRTGAALSTSHYLAANADLAYDQLPPDLLRVMRLSEITVADWEHMRTRGIQAAEDGEKFLVPENLDEPVARKLREFIVDRAHTAVLNPDAGTMARLRQGTQPGTPMGELNRTLLQFKGFPAAFTRQVLGREVYGHGESAWAQGSLMGLAQVMAMSTVLGYGAMAAKDIAKGKEPRSLTDEDGNLRWKTVLAALTQGGGAGIYGDYLFQDYSRFGGTPLETAAGPVFGTAAEAIKLGQGLAAGSRDAGDTLRFALNNTPFMNLFYTRPVLDYLFLHQLAETLSPGTLSRLEQRAQSEYGQTYWLPPTAAAR